METLTSLIWKDEEIETDGIDDPVIVLDCTHHNGGTIGTNPVCTWWSKN
ncbi:hypothetical protein JYG23_12935 [Sedimentibacter sp. zth1]|nr:hypothetical protein [Sedimentibacter sp. zth1]QSX05565.1 hypothetical protein JYG23_12935 [Sedimentibacter sp. zth1]